MAELGDKRDMALAMIREGLDSHEISSKAGEADRDAIGQVLSYMGDSAGDGKAVRGILVAGDFSARAISGRTRRP